MATIVIECGEHTDAECEAMSREIEELGVPNVLKGTDFACSCPFGKHGGWCVVEATDPQSALAEFGPVNQAHMKAYAVEMVRF
jgi:hypothetical protein